MASDWPWLSDTINKVTKLARTRRWGPSHQSDCPPFGRLPPLLPELNGLSFAWPSSRNRLQPPALALVPPWKLIASVHHCYITRDIGPAAGPPEREPPN